MPLSSCGSQSWNVFAPVPSGRQKVRKDHNSRGPLRDAAIKCGCNIRLSQFHMGWFDNRKARRQTKLLDGSQQHIVAGCLSRSMIDDDNTNEI